MSPAPVRTPRQGPDRFPYSWGYGAGVFLILAGFVVGIVMVATSVNGFVDDVRSFRRAVETGNLQASLEKGTEVFVYDESGRFDAGPFDVRVVRTSDDVEVATVPITGGTTYQVDGREGTARAEFKVPTSDIYRVEVDTSVGEVVGFAIGGDVGNDRTSGIIRGVVVGSVMVVAGLIALIVTSILHARWRLRGAVLDRVIQAREAVVSTTEPVASPEARDQAATSAAERATAWAEEQLGGVRETIDRQAGSGDPSSWRESLASQARDRLDRVEQALASAEPAVGEAAASADGAEALAARVDEALGRVQDRISAGDSLRDIARDERAAASEVASELAEQGRAASADAADRFQAAEAALVEQAGQPFADLRSDADALTSAAIDDLTGAAERTAGDARAVGSSAVEDLGTLGTGAFEEVSTIGTGALEDLTAAGTAAFEDLTAIDGGEQLAAGLAAAGTAAVAGTAAARAAEPPADLLGDLPLSSLPAPPQVTNRLPAPPAPDASSSLPAPPPPAPIEPPRPETGLRPPAPPPPPAEPEPSAPAAAVSAREPASHARGAAAGAGSEPAGTVTDRPMIAPPPAATALARSPLGGPTPVATPPTSGAGVSGRPADATAAASVESPESLMQYAPSPDLEQQARPGGPDSFSALAPPPQRSFLAPPPPSIGAPRIALRPASSPDPDPDAVESADLPTEAPAFDPDSAGTAPPPPIRPEFSLAPPPNHSGLPA